MATIQIKNMSFTYPASLHPVFENVTLDLDTSWRLGLVGRNGRGKTTFMNLLTGKLKGEGSIYSPERFEYFPFEVKDTGQTALEAARNVIAPFTFWEGKMARLIANPTPENIEKYGEIEEWYKQAEGYDIEEKITAEAARIDIEPSVLQNPFATLSGGEKVKLLLAAAFLKKHHFLLIDEPTDHLDQQSRRRVASWLAGKRGFILISHDRAFLDEAVDHILAINRAGIELQKGNYTSWRYNRTLQDDFEKAENQKLEQSIKRLREAARRTEKWSMDIEKTKTQTQGMASKGGPHMVDRGRIGHQAARMMQRSKSIERRKNREIEQKQALLKNIEEAPAIKFLVQNPQKSKLITAQDISLCFGQRCLFQNLSFTVKEGQRVAVQGDNGSGKSCLLKLLQGEIPQTKGSIERYGGLIISALPQETDFLKEDLRAFALGQGVDESLFMALLRKLDFEREAFLRPMQSYSAGQKKKVCLAASLAKPAHIFIWDEPLNYIDIISREQIENAVISCRPTMIFVEHDAAFVQAVATDEIVL